ncbi:MAG: chloramphenicol acetyltransferase [Clostridia bacterium]|nr:chloramphenicol acetyltransferase [Clostridia bacterium]
MKYIDLERWPRKEHVQFFSGISFPFYNVTSSLDVTRLYAYAKEHRLSFYYSLIYLTLTVMNGIPDFRYKIRGDKIVLHDKLHPSFVVLREPEHLLKIINLEMSGTMEEFCSAAQQRAEEQTNYFPSAESEQRDDLVYFSCTPWFSFTSLTNEMDSNPDDSIPRITWGKFEKKHGKLVLPYAVQLNHRLLDGYHLGLLLNGVQEKIDML